MTDFRLASKMPSSSPNLSPWTIHFGMSWRKMLVLPLLQI
uniref:Uncharacterized protein n=1 Tax=Lepeophtheirus salmonis TaxID=72036 RepID=A0A0K2VG00_LEPSM